MIIEFIIIFLDAISDFLQHSSQQSVIRRILESIAKYYFFKLAKVTGIAETQVFCFQSKFDLKNDLKIFFD